MTVYGKHSILLISNTNYSDKYTDNYSGGKLHHGTILQNIVSWRIKLLKLILKYVLAKFLVHNKLLYVNGYGKATVVTDIDCITHAH